MHGTSKQKETAAWALGNLAAHNHTNQEVIFRRALAHTCPTCARAQQAHTAIVEVGGFQSLLKTIARARARACTHAYSHAHTQMIVAAGGYQPLVDLAKAGTKRQREYAQRALQNLPVQVGLVAYLCLPFGF